MRASLVYNPEQAWSQDAVLQILRLGVEVLTTDDIQRTGNLK